MGTSVNVNDYRILLCGVEVGRLEEPVPVLVFAVCAGHCAKIDLAGMPLGKRIVGLAGLKHFTISKRNDFEGGGAAEG